MLFILNFISINIFIYLNDNFLNIKKLISIDFTQVFFYIIFELSKWNIIKK